MIDRILAICGVTVALCAAVTIAHLKTQVDSLSRENGTLTASLSVANETISALSHNENEAGELAAIRQDMRADLRGLVQEIANAPEADDAPLSPGMLAALQRLRDYHARHVAPAVADPDRVQAVREPDRPAADDAAERASPVADAGSGERLDVYAGGAKARPAALAPAGMKHDARTDDDDDDRKIREPQAHVVPDKS